MPTAEALFPTLDRRRRRPDPLASISAAVSSGVAAPPPAVPLAISEGLASTATPTYPRSIAARRQEALPSGVANEAREQLLGTGRGRGASLARIQRQKAVTRALAQIPDIGISRQVAPIVDRMAEKRGLPSSVLMAQLQQESNFTPSALSEADAGGISQFIPGTAEAYGVQYGTSKKQVRSQLRGQANYMDDLVDQTGSIEGALGGYYGSGTELLPSGKTYPQEVLEKAPAYGALDRVRSVKGSRPLSAPSAPDQRPGPWAGSKAIVKELLGPYARTEDWKDKEDRGDPGGTLHDIGTTNAFAADLSTSEALIDRIARKLGKENSGISPESVDYGTTGLESGLTYKGYDVEWLPYTHGSGPHNHLGIQWNGGSLPEGTTLGGGYASGDGGSTYTGPAVPMVAGGAPPMTSDRDTFRGASGSTPRSPLASRAAMPTRPGDEGEQSLLDLLAQESVDRRRIRTGRRTV